jgi:hypothetical protein
VRSATVTAATDMVVLVISRTELATLRALGIATMVEARIEAIANERLATLAALPADTSPHTGRETPLTAIP